MSATARVSVKTELLAGLTTFLTMSYILFVNPMILATEGTGMSFSGVLTATVLVCFSMTLLMGLFAKIPYAVAPGMGLNAFFAYTLVLGRNVPWPVALGIVFWTGVIFLVISYTPLREKIARAVPFPLQVGTAAGIGLFLAFIGLKNGGLVVGDPVTLVKLGPMGTSSLLSVFGLVLVLALMQRRIPGAFLLGILAVTVLSLALGHAKVPEHLVSAPDFSSVFLKLDIMGALSFAFVAPLISLLFTDFFDSLSTFMGTAHATRLVDESGHPKNLRQGLIVDSWATLVSSLFGTSSGTTYVESAAGIEAGGRTGLTSVFTALFFLPFLFLAPLAAMIPACATAPVLVIVGASMFRGVKSLNMEHLEDWMPAFLAMILIPLTFSITQGILWGFIAHVLLYLFVGRRKELSLTLVLLAALSAGLLALEQFR